MSGLEMKYFVLKPKGKDRYAEASRKALRAYAHHIAIENEDLAKDLLNWADKETDTMSKVYAVKNIMKD